MDIDDIVYHDDLLYIRGNVYNPDLERWCLFIASMDTIGNLLWHKVYCDTITFDHLAVNSPSGFAFSQDGKQIILPFAYFSQLDLGWLILDQTGEVIFQGKYVNSEKTIYPIDVLWEDGFIYLFGTVQRNNSYRDCYLLKLGSSGELIWQKYFGSSAYDQDFGDVYKNSDGDFTVSSREFNANEQDNNFWVKPWIFTVDTAGSVVGSWKGEKNDSRTFGWGPIYNYDNGDWLWASSEFREVTVAEHTFYAKAPTVTRFTSEFDLVWKIYLGHFTGFWDQLFDLEYDSLRDEFVTAGHRVTYYADSTFAELEPWVVRFTPDGEVLWSVSDTVVSFVGREMIHYTSGMDLSPSASAYVAGYVELDSPVRSYGWIVKVTPDGCMDTLCSTTSFEDQIKGYEDDFYLRPNPVLDLIEINLPYWQGSSILTLYDIQGRMIMQEKCTPGKNTFVTDFSAGLYFYSVTANGVLLESGKFLKL